MLLSHNAGEGLQQETGMPKRWALGGNSAGCDHTSFQVVQHLCNSLHAELLRYCT